MSEETPEINYLHVDEFRKEGFLQECNRLFMHPLGLALSVIVSDDETQVVHLKGKLPNGTDISGHLLVPKTVKLDLEDITDLELNPVSEILGPIWDYRDDPEGIIFGEGALDPEKVRRVANLRDSKARPRSDLLGTPIQSVKTNVKK
jgi:hypothetical protein